MCVDMHWIILIGLGIFVSKAHYMRPIHHTGLLNTEDINKNISKYKFKCTGHNTNQFLFYR